MKDYRVDKDKEQQYITSVKLVKVSGNEVYEVEFADGQIFKNIKKDDENIKKIIEAQEKQAASGVANQGFFRSKRMQSGMAAIGTAAGTCALTSVVATGLTSITATQPNPLIAPITIGVLTIVSAIPGFARLVKNHQKVKELEKIEYRNDNKATLDSFRNYPNSLAGFTSDKKKKFKNSSDPFSIINIDNYSIEDLEDIVSNINREKTYQFKYASSQEKNKK